MPFAVYLFCSFHPDCASFLASSGLMRESGDSREVGDECSTSNNNTTTPTPNVQDRLTGQPETEEDSKVEEVSSTSSACSNKTDSQTDQSTEISKLEEAR